MRPVAAAVEQAAGLQQALECDHRRLGQGLPGLPDHEHAGARVLPAEHIGDVVELDYIVRTGDEVLDYRDAVARYRGCEQIVEAGGDHGFGDFDRYLDRSLAFCGVLKP